MKTIKELKNETKHPVVLADQTGIITYINKSFEKSYGWNEKDLIGKPLTTIIPPIYHTQHHLGFSRFIVTEKSNILNQELKLKIRAKDGKTVDATHLIIAEKIEGNWYFGAIIKP